MRRTRVSRLSLFLSAACSAALLPHLACLADPGPDLPLAPQSTRQSKQPLPSLRADLRVDSNRDGGLSDDDELGEDTNDRERGAIVLANLDDDTLRCDPTVNNDAELARCNDAEDDVVNGADDLLDMTEVQVLAWEATPDDAVGRFDLGAAEAPFVRAFMERDGAWTAFDLATQRLSSAQLRTGVQLMLEAKDIVRDASRWDGLITLTLIVETAETKATDTVVLRVAPVLSFHHLSETVTAYASHVRRFEVFSAPFLADMAEAAALAQVSFEALDEKDPWTQDFFETGYMSKPGPDGTQHAIYTAFRSSNLYRSGGKPIREAGRFVFRQFRGKDRAGLVQYDRTRSPPSMDSANSFGNFETIPPYSHDGRNYPNGRVLRGKSASFYPDPSFTQLIDSQGVQPAIDVDTSWLTVGHVDETMSFIRANTPRGWVLLLNDPALAKKMLEDAVAAGHGDARMFVGKSWAGEQSTGGNDAEVSIRQVLRNADVMAESARSAAEIAEHLLILQRETGITEEEIVRIPYLHQTAGGGSLAYKPATINGMYIGAAIGDGVFAAPDPHGPVIAGKDIMKAQMEEALAPFGVQVVWIENWDLYHAEMGEVHCGSNALRAVPSTAWWQALPPPQTPVVPSIPRPRR